MTKVSVDGGGISAILLVVFIVLKLCKVIDWSWWWVFSPLWIPFAIVIFILIIIGLFQAFNK